MEVLTDFEQFLANKRIDSTAFKKSEPGLWQELKDLFQQVHPNSFTAQKLFLINGIRRKYILAEEFLPEVITKEPADVRTEGKPVAQKPKTGAVKPKFKIPIRKPKED